MEEIKRMEPTPASILRNTQQPLKAKYKSRPPEAMITLKAEGKVDCPNLTCKVDVGHPLGQALPF
jgi:hypothetical protein